MNPNLVYRRLELLENSLKTLIRRLELLEARIDGVDGTAAAEAAVVEATKKARARIGV